MSLIDAVRRRIRVNRSDAEIIPTLAQTEALLRAGGAPHEVRALAAEVLAGLEAAEVRHNDEHRLRLAAAQLLCGDLEAAVEHARACAHARPYDVDSRVIHGNVRLARHELDEAAHEFDAVIEEFGADADAAAGRRAVILARGEGPFDELPAGDEDWRAAAALLVGLWAVSDLVEERLSALSAAHADALTLLRAAAERIANGEGDDGAV